MSMTLLPRKSRGEPLSPMTIRQVHQLVASEGEYATLKRLRISRNALYRALAHLPILLGTRELIVSALRGDL